MTLSSYERLGLRSMGFRIDLDLDDTFGNALKKYRKWKGWTQAELAEKMGMTSNYYGLIERDSNQFPKRRRIYEIAEALELKGIETRDLLLRAGRLSYEDFPMGMGFDLGITVEEWGDELSGK